MGCGVFYQSQSKRKLKTRVGQRREKKTCWDGQVGNTWERFFFLYSSLCFLMTKNFQDSAELFISRDGKSIPENICLPRDALKLSSVTTEQNFSVFST